MFEKSRFTKARKGLFDCLIEIDFLERFPLDEDALGRIITLCYKGQKYATRLIELSERFDVRGVSEYSNDLSHKIKTYTLLRPAKTAMLESQLGLISAGRKC